MTKPYSPPPGYYDLPFTWIYDASALAAGGSYPNQTVYLKANLGDFLLRRVVGLSRILDPASGLYQIQDFNGKYIESEPVAGASADDIGVLPELLYPKTGQIRFDLVNTLIPMDSGCSQSGPTPSAGYPVTIQPTPQGYDFEQSVRGSFGGFYNGAHWAFLFEGGFASAGPGDLKIHALKSTDSGETWSEQDAAGAPSPVRATGFGSAYTVSAPDGNTVWLILMDPQNLAAGINGFYVLSFNLSTGTWGTLSTLQVAPQLEFWGGTGPVSASAICLMNVIVRGPADYVFLFNGPLETVGGKTWGRVYACSFDGTTFGSPVMLSGQAGLALSFTGTRGAVDSAGRTHFFLTGISSTPAAFPVDVFHVAMQPGTVGTFGTVSTVTAQFSGFGDPGSLSEPSIDVVAGVETISILAQIEDAITLNTALALFTGPAVLNPAWTSGIITEDPALVDTVGGNDVFDLNLGVAFLGGSFVASWLVSKFLGGRYQQGSVYSSKSSDGVTWSTPSQLWAAPDTGSGHPYYAGQQMFTYSFPGGIIVYGMFLSQDSSAPAASSWDCAQNNFVNVVDIGSNFSGVYGSAISMLSPAAPGDEYSSFAVVQPDAKLFLSFLTSALGLISTVDMSTVGATVTAPAGTAYFLVSCANATLGGSYDLRFSVNAPLSPQPKVAYTVLPDVDGVSYDTAFSYSNGATQAGSGNGYPLGIVVSSLTITVSDNTDPGTGMQVVFYDGSFNVLSSTFIPSGPVTTPIVLDPPAGAAFWAIVNPSNTAGFYDFTFTLNNPTGFASAEITQVSVFASTQASTAQIAFQGVRRLPAPDLPQRVGIPRTYTRILEATLAPPLGSVVTVQQLIDSYDFELYQIILVKQVGTGLPGPLTTPAASLTLYDSNRVAVSSLPMLDLFMDGGPGGVYKNGAVVPPLFYPQNSQVQIDVVNQLSSCSGKLFIYLVGRQYYRGC